MKPEKLSILSTLAASSCCILPLAFLGLSLIGLGTASMAGVSTFIGSLKWYLIAFAVVGQGVSYVFYFRERRKCKVDSCSATDTRSTRNILFASSAGMLVFLSWMIYSIVVPPNPVMAAAVPGGSAAVAIFDVTGMTCAGCEFAIAESVSAQEGVDSARASFVGTSATVWFSDTLQTVDDLATAIASVGYSSELVTVIRRSE
jgi:mercuric ion transport protein